MSQQPQQKASNKRTGKRITFFNESQGQPVNTYSAPSNNMLNAVMYTQERPDGVRINQQQVPGKWNVGDQNEATWAAQQTNMWQRNAAGYAMQMVPSYYNHHEPIKRSQDKGVGVSQMDIYGDALQQMMSQKTQLEQHQLARQQAHLNSILQAQQQQQQQQQQHHHQNQHLALQSFQTAFGHQGQKTSLPNLFHVFPDAQSNAAYVAQQQKQQTALPKMQLFESFYPSQQQQQAAYSMQQGVSLSQHAVSQQKIPVMSQLQRVPTTEEYMKALVEQSQQSVLPKTQIPLPRRSRRLSKEGPEPLPPTVVGQSNNPYPHHQYEQGAHQLAAQERYKQLMSRDAHETQHGNRHDIENVSLPHNGKPREVLAAEQNSMGPVQPAGAGAVTVIQSTRRRRRISQEANLFTLAQKAAEMPNLENTKDNETLREKNETLKSNVEIPSASPPKKSRGDGDLKPLVMPVSVPVKMVTGQEKRDDERTHRAVLAEKLPFSSMPTVIVTRHRVGPAGVLEPPIQNNETASLSETPSRKPKQRPRPEPLFIPPKSGTFVVPVYTNITPYQSHLRSPVRVPEHVGDKNFELPPYTPPPILSPVREGSGLYFNAIISANTHSMPPPITPKSSTRTLLRSNSGEDMPPLLTAEATPVSLEPRINIGARFQADIPDLKERSLAFADKHKADVVWCPWDDLENKQAVEQLLTAACSSILPGGGTNQELALHYLHESRGNILAALTKLLLMKPKRHKGHHLANYHYSGSDRWSVNEKRLFNKGMAIYKKDFLLVQKLIKTKTVAQCVEFYYTYKKQVKIGRNGMLIFGDVEALADEKNPREDSEIDIKSSQRLGAGIPPQNTEGNDTKMGNDVHAAMEEEDEKKISSQTKVTQTLQASEILNDTLILRNQDPDISLTVKIPKPRGRRPKASIPGDDAKKAENASKPPAQEGTFPCKKCGRVFTKVKSRSAHMKSHAEQEKKAAAQKQSEAAAAAAARAALHARSRQVESSDSESSSDSGSITSSSSESCDSSDDGEI